MYFLSSELYLIITRRILYCLSIFIFRAKYFLFRKYPHPNFLILMTDTPPESYHFTGISIFSKCKKVYS